MNSSSNLGANSLARTGEACSGSPVVVMAGLVPAIHVFLERVSKTWITGLNNEPGDDG